jgi:hypothetical protein
MSLKKRWMVPWLASPLLCVAVHAHAQSVKDQCIDANEEAQRQKRAGEFHAARARLDVCRREECPAPVRKDCVELSNAIDAAMPTVIFEARDPQGAPVTAAKVTMDGRPFAARLDGGATAVDPGWHRFEFEARSSTFAFVIGTLLVAGGATLYFMAPKMTVSAAPTARADGAGLAVSGAW